MSGFKIYHSKDDTDLSAYAARWAAGERIATPLYAPDRNNIQVSIIVRFSLFYLASADRHLKDYIASRKTPVSHVISGIENISF